jgi:hypothetical protein
MKYWTYAEPTSETDSTPIYYTFSEEEIIDKFWGWWYPKMCNKFGKKVVDENYCKEDCIDDWVTIHWALEVRK